jgi:signal transduction histidine kinase
MRSLPATAAGPIPKRPDSKRSIKSGTLLSWRTDLNLKLVGVTRRAGVKLRSLPAVGQVIVKGRRRTGFLDSGAHLQALGGKEATYRFRLFREIYEVRVVARRDRRKRIIGVQGTLQRAQPGASPGTSPPELKRIQGLARKRRRNCYNSALRSMELARAVADTARVNAEIRTERAARQEKQAIEAQFKAENQERRARVLADASSILDSSFDQRDTMQRMGKMLVLRVVDWCAIYSRSDSRLSRVVLEHRGSQNLETLERVFPPGNETGFFETGFFEKMNQGRWELFPLLTTQDVVTIFPASSHRQAFRKLNTQSLIRTCIVSHGRMVGVLFMGSADPMCLFGVQDLQMARDLGSRIGQAWESSRLYDEAQKEIALRREVEARLRVFNVELERRVGERTSMLEEATREANSFAYTVAHDLRAPLRAITGFCQALREDYAGLMDEVGKDYLDRVVSGARRMDELIRDLLDYARLNRAEIRKGVVDLEELVGGVLEPMDAELTERNAKLSVEKPLGRVVGQAPVLGQALTNIVSNAVKFVEPGVSPEVRIRSELHGSRTRVVVEDNGIGIAPEHQERIFGIFERLNRAEQYPGTGIGLAIVRRAVERLGGSVGVDSQLGQGSRFWIELPTA